MWRKSFLVVLFSILTLAFRPVHPFYVSLTEINYNPNREALEITMKIFIDDMEKALSAMAPDKVVLGGDWEHPEADILIERYLRNTFELRDGDRTLNWQYLGKETDLEAVWIYTEATSPTAPKELWVRNAVLIEQFDNQVNMVNFTTGEKTRSLLLNKGNESGTIDL